MVLVYALRYFWGAARGYRLRPWASPYLRWRLETYLGVHADRLTWAEFFRLLWRHRERLRQFLRWSAEMERKYLRGS